MLTAHPEFVAPKFRKGFNWLTRTRFKGFYDFEWYTTNIGQPLSRRFLNSLESDSDPVELSDSFSAKGDRVSRHAIVGEPEFAFLSCFTPYFLHLNILFSNVNIRIKPVRKDS